jgi:hypothetical protein
MIDRSFNENDLREMLQNAIGFRPDASPGRFIVTAHRANRAWEIVVEPDAVANALVVVTASPTE